MALSKQNNPLRLLIIGEGRAGKSATGNTILGRQEFKTEYERLFTGKVQKAVGTVDGRRVEVTDSTCLFEAAVSEEQSSFDLKRAMDSVHPGPHAILLCISLKKEFTSFSEELYDRIKMIFGDIVTNFIVVVLTSSDIYFGAAREATHDDFYNNAPLNLMRILKECGRREVFFQNEVEDFTQHQQVAKLLKIIDNLGGIIYRPPAQMTKQAVQNQTSRRMLDGSQVEASYDRDRENVEMAQKLREHFQQILNAEIQKLTTENQKVLREVEDAAKKRLEGVQERTEKALKHERKQHQKEMEKVKAAYELKLLSARIDNTIYPTRCVFGFLGILVGVALLVLFPASAPVAVPLAVCSASFMAGAADTRQERVQAVTEK